MPLFKSVLAQNPTIEAVDQRTSANSSASHHRLEYRQRLIPLLNEICSIVRQLRWLVMLPDGELIKDLRLPTSPHSWFRQIGGQLKAITITTGLEPLSGLRIFDRARWRKGWVKVSSECALNGRSWSASIGRRG